MKSKLIAKTENYTQYTNTNKLKFSTLAVSLLLLLPTLSFAKDKKDGNAPKNNRSEIVYKQKHSSFIVGNKDNVYADGIRIKRDLTILQELQEERILSADEIPAEELYGGLWDTRYAHVYHSLENRPDSFRVNLENFSMPIANGHVTSIFGKRGRRMHNGIDLKVQVGDTIYAAFEGKVRVKRFEKKGYGNYVTIRHSNGLETIYGHLSKFLVTENDVVKSGDPIALGGNTGRSTGAHLHFEFRFLGQAINPSDIVDFDNFVCHRDEFLVNTVKTNYPSPTAKSTNTKYASGSIKYHRVKKGETLYGIARQYGTTEAAIRKTNNMGANKVLLTGTSLKL